jgi:hypothetical protein
LAEKFPSAETPSSTSIKILPRPPNSNGYYTMLGFREVQY